MYIYPDNLKSKAVLWLWELRDIAIIGVGALISVFAMAQLGFLPPVVITAAYAFLSIRLEDTSILDFLRYAIRYFLLGQQTYAWGLCNPSTIGVIENEQKKRATAKQTTRQLIGIDEIADMRPKDQSWELISCHQAHQPLGPAPGGCEQSHLCPHDRPQGAG